VGGIREAGRNTMGVKLVNLDAGDKLQAVASVISEDKDETPEPSQSKSTGAK
jgi:DNA gyrase subunit A